MKGELRRIVVAADGSDHALSAVHWGAHLAAAADAELTLVHVLEIRLLEGPLFADLSGLSGAGPFEHVFDNFSKALHERGRNILEVGRKLCEEHGVAARIRMVKGVFSEAIAEVAADANLLVLGRRGEHAAHGLHLLGSDGERAIRHVDCSCLVVPAVFREPEVLVVGIQDSGPARSAARWAAYLRDVAPILAVRPLHVSPTPTTDPFSGERVAGVPVQCVAGDPTTALLQACAEAPETTLCLIGATGHTHTLKELILGTLSFHVLHKVTGPVLLAR